MANVELEIKRDPSFPEGELGAWDAKVIVDGKVATSVHMARSREHAIELARERWNVIRDGYLADPDPSPERIPLV